MVKRASGTSGSGLADLLPGMLKQSHSPRGGWPASLPADPQIARCLLRAAPASVRTARAAVRDTLTSCGLTELSDDAATVVSELVTNAIQHGSQNTQDNNGIWPIQLIVLHNHCQVMTVVTDHGHGTSRPAIVHPAMFAENGRGLRIVKELSTSWGWARLVTGGTAVWATVQRPQHNSHSRDRPGAAGMTLGPRTAHPEA